MILGVGIDLVDIERMETDLASEAFVRRVFTDEEILYCRSRPKPAESYAGKFAAKEAFMKAIGAGIRQGVWFTDIEVLNKPNGQPYLKLNEKLENYANILDANVSVSLSHTRYLATAIVLIEKEVL
jgi:holo-[acyl-carrier protein] synthase